MGDSPSADTRTKRQKMEDRANDSASSSTEADFARAWLDSHPRKTLSRDQILGMPDLRAAIRSIRVWDPALRVHVMMDVDDPAFSGMRVVTDDDDEFWDGED